MTANIIDNSTAAKIRLSPKSAELLSHQANGRPEWIRPPKSGLEFYSGFSRARLYQGAKDGDFRSVSIRKPGQVKGTRLFHLQSILDFIARCEKSAAEETAAQKEAAQ